MKFSLLSRKSIVDSRKSRVAFRAAMLLLCVVIVLGSCKSAYRNFKHIDGDTHCIEKFAPQFSNTLYSAYVDVTKHHFSGILFFKLMPDSSMRVVFTNEMGVKFFDFAFTKEGGFVKYYVMKKMDKMVVVNALRKDIELVLMHPDYLNAKLLTNGSERYIAFPDKKGHDYYVTDNDCTHLLRIEKASPRKPIEYIKLFDYKEGIPDSIDIRHKNFKFSIALKKIER